MVCGEAGVRALLIDGADVDVDEAIDKVNLSAGAERGSARG
jgi:hypothetical protein